MNYINSIMEKYPPFKTKEEEDAMIEKYLQKNDIDGMKNELVLRNVGLIRLYNKSWRSLYSEDESASFGIEGLIKAANTFDPKNGVRFSTYAGKAIRTWLQRNKKSIRDKIDERSVSLDSKIDTEDQNGESLSNILDSKVRDEFKVIKQNEYYIANNETLALIIKMMKIAGCSEKEIRYFYKVNFSDKKLSEIAEEGGISRERIRQVSARVSYKLIRNIDKLTKFLLNEKKPEMKDFEIKHTYNSFEHGRVVTRDYVCGMNWSKYYDAVRLSDDNCIKKLKQIIKEGILK